jgi:hypothetical protein
MPSPTLLKQPLTLIESPLPIINLRLTLRQEKIMLLIPMAL